MKETEKYDNWMKFLTVSVIVIIVCVFTLTVTNTHLAKGTYSAGTEQKTCYCYECYNGNYVLRNEDDCDSINCGSMKKTTEHISGTCDNPNPTVTPPSTETPTSGFDQTACADEADLACGTSNWTGCRTSYQYTCKSNSFNKCEVSVSTNSVNVSVDKDDVDNSYYTVAVNFSGDGCEGQTISYSASNAKKLSATSYKISSNSGTTSFDVYPNDPCTVSVAAATLSNGKSDSTSAVTTINDWVPYTVCVENPEPKSFEEADRIGSNVYYSDPNGCNGHSGWYTTKWVRYGCGGGGSGSDPTPSEDNPTSSATYACYLVNHKYVWASSKPSGGTLVSSITTESKCSGCESSYTPDNNNNCVKPSSNPSSNVTVNPKTGTVGIIVAWVIGLAAIVYSLWFFKKSSSIK